VRAGLRFSTWRTPNASEADERATRKEAKVDDKTFVSAEVNQKRKEVRTMKYVKPELVVLARAVAAVQGMTKGSFINPDAPPDTRFHSIPAYEADE